MSSRDRTFDIRVRADGVDIEERRTFPDEEGQLENAIKDVLDAARRQVPDRRLRRLRLDADEVF